MMQSGSVCAVRFSVKLSNIEFTGFYFFQISKVSVRVKRKFLLTAFTVFVSVRHSCHIV